MRLKQYITELSMKKGTKISAPKYFPASTYIQEIELADGIKFTFYGYYFGGNHFQNSDDYWDVTFEDQNGRTIKTDKRQGASLELFAALEKVFKTFLETVLPNVFVFSADIEEKSRVKLYDLLAKKIEKYGAGYKFKRQSKAMIVKYIFTHWSVSKK